ncbi:hypothetical protein CPB85DRAFT_1250666 [Mucidula mucida]|nr:hypothetical protein CPB85DRAFT_1250666 [Mucidula mucida]
MATLSSPRHLRNRTTPAIPVPRQISRIPVSSARRTRGISQGLNDDPEVARNNPANHSPSNSLAAHSRSNSLDSLDDFDLDIMPSNDPPAIITPGTRMNPPVINQTSEKLTDKHFKTYQKHCVSWLATVHPKADPKKVVPLLAPGLVHQQLENYYDARSTQLDVKTVEEFVDALRARSHGPEHFKHIYENLKKAKQGTLHVNDWFEFVIVTADKLAGSKKYALTDRDRIATIRDGLSVRMKNKILERKDIEEYGDSIADGSCVDAEKWTKYQDKLQEIQELINAQEENEAGDGNTRNRPSVAAINNFAGIPAPVWPGASIPSYNMPQPGSAGYAAVAAVTADAGVRSLEEWFTLRYMVNGCLKCLMPWQNHRGADNKCRDPEANCPERNLRWCLDWASANPNGFENATLAPGFQPRRPTNVSAEDIGNTIAYNMAERGLKTHLIPDFYRRFRPDLFVGVPPPQAHAPGSRRVIPPPRAPQNNAGYTPGTGSNSVPVPAPSRSFGTHTGATQNNFAMPAAPTNVGVLFQHSSYDIPGQSYSAWQPQTASRSNVASVNVGRGRQMPHSGLNTAAVLGEYPNNDYDSSADMSGNSHRYASRTRSFSRSRAAPSRSRERSPSERVTRARQATDSPRYERTERKLPANRDRKEGWSRSGLTERDMKDFLASRAHSPSPADRRPSQRVRDSLKTSRTNEGEVLPELFDVTDDEEEFEEGDFDDQDSDEEYVLPKKLRKGKECAKSMSSEADEVDEEDLGRV